MYVFPEYIFTLTVTGVFFVQDNAKSYLILS